jgi:GINS complex subunit 4
MDGTGGWINLHKILTQKFIQIDTHPLHILSLHNLSLGQSSLMSTPLLSPSEHQYLTTHQALLAAHYHSSFLSQFPALLQRLDDTTGGTNMIDTPDVDAAVFVRALKDAGVMEIEGTGTTCDIKRGDVWVVRWSAISAWVKAGDLEVI